MEDERYHPSQDVEIPPKPKAEGAPSRPKSAYILFTQQNRGRVKEENPELKMIAITRLLAAEWKELDGDDRKEFDDRALEALEEYREQRREYADTPKYKRFLKRRKEWRELYGEAFREQEYERREKKEQRRQQRAERKEKNAGDTKKGKEKDK